MANILGNVAAAGQIALQFITNKPKRGLDDGAGTLIVPDATIEEVHSDEMEITEHPVEQGTTISDHAFNRPAELIVTAGWSDSPNNSGIGTQLVGAAANSNAAVRAVIGAAQLANSVGSVVGVLSGNAGGSPSAAAYAFLLDMQRSRTLFTIYTGKRVYRNMLIKSLATTTDLKTENSAIIRIGCRQLLMAQTQTVTVPDSSVMKNPEQNGAVINKGTVTPLPAPNINTAALLKFGIKAS